MEVDGKWARRETEGWRIKKMREGKEGDDDGKLTGYMHE